MRIFHLLLLSLFVFYFSTPSAVAQANKTRQANKITWKKIVIDTNFRSEGIAVVDVNLDGKPDLIVGDCWYEAPKQPGAAWQRHILRADRKFDPDVPGLYSESFACFAGDFNSDGFPDVIVIPFPGKACYWYENPGAKGGMWTPHLLATSACNETPIYVDLFKTGNKVLVMGWNPPKDVNDPKKGNYDDRGEMCYFVPGKDPTQPWQRVSISGPWAKGKPIPGTAKFAHGLGHGDVNGDGRIDILCTQGWWEQPQQLDGKPWQWHSTKIGEKCADMYVLGKNGAGLADIVSSSAHDYGLWLHEQRPGNVFLTRDIFPTPPALAREPAGYKFNKDEQALVDGINKLRDSNKRAPFKVDAKLCEIARKMAKLEIILPKEEKGRAMVARVGANDLNTALANFRSSTASTNPNLAIGVGASQRQFHILLADIGHFALPGQTHALHMVDIDGDGLKDLVTGRRWRAHGPKGDVSPADPAYLYWFQARRDKEGAVTFVPHLIDDDSGIGTQFAIADVNGDGVPDIAVSNKKGVYLFLQVR